MDREIQPIKSDELWGDTYEDPTFGTIGFSRGQGTARALFGSSIKHNHTIQLEVKTAHMVRGINMDRIFGDKIICRVEMSPTQFADAITGLNSAEVPVTIRYTRDEGAVNEEAPFQNKVAQFNKEFKEDIAHLSVELEEVLKLAHETKAQKRLIHALEQAKMHFKENVPFVNTQFAEQMEKTVTEAKGEVEAFVTSMVKQYGIEAIRAQAPQLCGPTEVKEIGQTGGA